MIRPALKIIGRYAKADYDLFQVAFCGILDGTRRLLREERRDPVHVLNYIRVVIRRYVIDYLNQDHNIRIPREALKNVRLKVSPLTGEEIRILNVAEVIYDLDLNTLEEKIVQLIVHSFKEREICRTLNIRRQILNDLKTKLRDLLSKS